GVRSRISDGPATEVTLGSSPDAASPPLDEGSPIDNEESVAASRALSKMGGAARRRAHGRGDAWGVDEEAAARSHGVAGSSSGWRRRFISSANLALVSAARGAHDCASLQLPISAEARARTARSETLEAPASQASMASLRASAQLPSVRATAAARRSTSRS